MTAYVNIVVAERKDALLVPNAALRFKPTGSELLKAPANQSPAPSQKSDGQKNDAQKNTTPSGGRPGETAAGGKPKRDAFSGKVFVLEQGVLKPISVLLGITDNRNTEIVGGELKAGDQVVVGEAQAGEKSSGATGRPPMRMF